jgi:hypothetical protein
MSDHSSVYSWFFKKQNRSLRKKADRNSFACFFVAERIKVALIEMYFLCNTYSMCFVPFIRTKKKMDAKNAISAIKCMHVIKFASAAGHSVNSILASTEAKGFDEALLLDQEEYIAEATVFDKIKA